MSARFAEQRHVEATDTIKIISDLENSYSRSPHVYWTAIKFGEIDRNQSYYVADTTYLCESHYSLSAVVFID